MIASCIGAIGVRWKQSEVIHAKMGNWVDGIALSRGLWRRSENDGLAIEFQFFERYRGRRG